MVLSPLPAAQGGGVGYGVRVPAARPMQVPAGSQGGHLLFSCSASVSR